MSVSPSERTVVVLGASSHEYRYSNKAVRKLLDAGYIVVPVHPTETVVHGVPVVPSLKDVQGPVDTVTVYVAPKHRLEYEQDLLAMAPRHVVFNPGAESPETREALLAHGISVEEACTLVLLSINQF